MARLTALAADESGLVLRVAAEVGPGMNGSRPKVRLLADSTAASPLSVATGRMAIMYRIESDVELSSDWLPPEAFATVYASQPAAVATAIEGVDDPAEVEVRVVDATTGQVVWRSKEEEFECPVSARSRARLWHPRRRRCASVTG